MKPLKIAALVAVAAILSFIAPSALSQNALRIFSESGGQYSSFLPEAPTYVNAKSLAASTAESFTVPTGATRVIFSATCNFYANPTTTATVPGDVTDGSASMLNPAGWGVRDVTAISVIASVACVVTAAFYK
jgi:hypothetical protein